MSFEIDEPIRLRVRRPELENSAFERRIESGCGVGRRLMNYDGRRSGNRVIDHTFLAQRREWIGLFPAVDLKAEDDLARSEPSVVSDGAGRRRTRVRDALAPLLADKFVHAWHSLGVSGQRL